jgi:hypothetical protein
MNHIHAKLFRRLLIVAGILSANNMMSYAQAPVQVTTTAVPFLQITPDTRAGGMANMGIATSADADAMFHNLSKSVLNEDKGNISLNYTPWLRNATSGISFISAAGNRKLDDNQSVSASLRYFNMGDVPVSDYSGKRLGIYRPNEFAFDLGYSRKLSEKFSIGIAARYIYSKLADGSVNGVNYTAGNAFAGDISAFYNGIDKEGNGFTAGVALSNLGSRIGYTSNSSEKAFIPANAGIGAAYTKTFDEQNKITFGVEANKLLVPATPVTEEEMHDYYNTGVMQSWSQSFGNTAYKLGAGIEYSYCNVFNLRAGYTFDGDDIGNSKYLTAGAGLKYDAFELNFAYLVPSGATKAQSAMANTLRFGLIYHFAEKK